MRIEELSVGDWVKYKEREWQVFSLDKFTGEVGLWRKDSQITEDVTYIEPIPLTPEILENNGFDKFSECGWRNSAIKCFLFRYGTKYWDIKINGRNRAYRPTRIRIENILHTHQLQHALHLAGIEKEIEL